MNHLPDRPLQGRKHRFRGGRPRGAAGRWPGRPPDGGRDQGVRADRGGRRARGLQEFRQKALPEIRHSDRRLSGLRRGRGRQGLYRRAGRPDRGQGRRPRRGQGGLCL